MSHRISILFIVVCTLSSSVAVRAAEELDLSALAASTRPSVVHLEVLDATGKAIGNGSGFFVTRDGLIATNYHVIERAHAIRGVTADGTSIDIVGIAARSKQDDLAVIVAPPNTYPALPLGGSASMQQGARVIVIGSPRGLSGTLSEGILSARRDKGIETGTGDSSRGERTGALLQITAPISPGSSGSPVISEGGAVIGVAVSVMQGAQNLNFAVPVERLASLLIGIDPGLPPEAFHPIAWGNLALSAMTLIIVGIGIAMTGRKKGGGKTSERGGPRLV